MKSIFRQIRKYLEAGFGKKLLTEGNQNEIEYYIKSITNNGTIKIKKLLKAGYPSKLGEQPFIIKNNSDYIFYSFSFNSQNNKQKIFYNPRNPDYPLNLLRLLSACFVHGDRDRKKTLDQKLNLITSRALSLRCGSVSNLTQHLLDSVGIKSRVVAVLTLDNWNHYDNGHTMLEVYFENLKKWVVIDLDTKHYFSIPNIAFASLLELAENNLEDIKIHKLYTASYLDYSSMERNQILSEYHFYNPEAWFRRILQAFSIYDDNYYYFYPPGKSSTRIEQYSSRYTIIERDEFIEKFYA